MADPDYDGQSYLVDREIGENGPITVRKCTDVGCLCILIGLIATLIWAAIYCIQNQQLKLMLSGVDADQGVCGYDDHLKEYNKAYFVV